MAKWTKAQARAIYEPSGEGNILVSAAAGSGKTAVLVERIAEMVTRAENPVSIDSLLVVTFTEAAAAEMKERIIKRIGEAQSLAAKNGDTASALRLREQMHLTASADISTIDSFCLGVVKNNFHILGIDPNFGIMDKSGGDVLKDDTLTELFDRLYSSEDAEEKREFERLVRMYASNRDDEGLKKIILKLYEGTQYFADPIEWLREQAAMYSSDMTESTWVKENIIKPARENALMAAGSVFAEVRDELMKIAAREYGVTLGGTNYLMMTECTRYWGSLWEKTVKCADAVEMLKACESWEDYFRLYETYIKENKFLGTANNSYTKATEADKELWTSYFSRIHPVRNDFRKICRDNLPKLPRDEYNEAVHAPEMKRTIDALVWLVEKFDALFEEKKEKQGNKTFSDIEHLAYRLFKENENIRAEYRDRYTEILIDEFQDTNGLQDALFTLISKNSGNMFMVGDLKQSIYRFRGGNPMIFKGKSKQYANGSGGKLISLSQNFRSRTEILCGINEIFSAMMSDEVGDVDYVGDEMLNRDKDKDVYTDGDNLLSAANKSHGYGCDFCRVAVVDDETDEEENLNGARAEAAVIARKIRAMVDEKYKIHIGDGNYKDIEYRDIVVLMKSVKNDGAVLKAALEGLNIPSFVQKEEYFERREIKLMMSLLTLINNHRQDIPLAAVMRSPIGGFSDTDLARIRIKTRVGQLFDAVKAYRAGEDASDGERRLEMRCGIFIKNLDRWRGYVKRKPIAALIWSLYEETRLYDFMGALEGGEEAQANLRLLYERAGAYEKSGFRGIFNFIRYVEKMERRREDIEGAQLVNANHNVVRVMTIHKSKGLEFPIVFLTRLTKHITYTFPKEEKRVVMNNELGIAADYFNYEEMYKRKLPYTGYVKAANKREHKSEEIRLLYVAATRAKEKLIATASYKFADRDAYEAQLSAWADEAGAALPAGIGDKATCLADWILPVAQRQDTTWRCEDIALTSADYEVEQPEAEPIEVEDKESVREAVNKILEYCYEYPESGRIPAKTSVTAIKAMADEENIREGHNDTEPVYMASKPDFLRGVKTGARIGTAHHQVMAYINLDTLKTLSRDKYSDFIASEIERISAAGQIEPEIAADKAITDKICKNIAGFFTSDMGSAVLSARRVWRESPFEIEIPATECVEGLDARYEGETALLQGIIDLFFEDNNGDIILVDYKTDQCKTEEQQRIIGERYRRQIEMYERAMEKILKRSVKNKYLYLFSAQSVLQLD